MKNFLKNQYYVKFINKNIDQYTFIKKLIKNNFKYAKKPIF